jgi:hypothetical protein
MTSPLASRYSIVHFCTIGGLGGFRLSNFDHRLGRYNQWHARAELVCLAAVLHMRRLYETEKGVHPVASVCAYADRDLRMVTRHYSHLSDS